MSKYDITIIFKSGRDIQFKANDFNVAKNNGQLTAIDWNCEGLEIFPARINVENIDAILVRNISQ